jgi:pyruvate dehydrogenase E2 component (dihydrolipoamide acetyltransferase)
MHKILLVAAATLTIACQAAYAQDPAKIQLAQATATTPAAPAADPAPAAPAPAAAPAAEPAPAADAAPATKTTKPAKKKVAKRRSWESDEAKARGIAAKYGVTW